MTSYSLKLLSDHFLLNLLTYYSASYSFTLISSSYRSLHGVGSFVGSRGLISLLYNLFYQAIKNAIRCMLKDANFSILVFNEAC
jgi:hypothetical protein